MSYEIYYHKTLPNHWIARTKDGYLVLVPTVRGGWEKRTTYRGHMDGMHRLPEHTARSVASLLGGEHDIRRS
jgi:hypothetical protein